LESKAVTPKYAELRPGIEASIATLKKYYIHIDDSDMAVVSMGEHFLVFFIAVTPLAPPPVLNPVIKSEYFATHWDLDYQSKAEESVRKVVRISSLSYCL